MRWHPESSSQSGRPDLLGGPPWSSEDIKDIVSGWWRHVVQEDLVYAVSYLDVLDEFLQQVTGLRVKKQQQHDQGKYRNLKVHFNR